MKVDVKAEQRVDMMAGNLVDLWVGLKAAVKAASRADQMALS